jgi:lipid II:glycine glycyltransferase (peptidoglycan interpeptide bridge formation enzyme)
MELTINATEPSVWDRFVSASDHGHYMQSHAWGEMQRHAGWEPHYLSLAEGGAPRAAALLLSRSIPATGRKIFYTPRGPVGDSCAAEAYRELGAALQEYVRTNGGTFLRADPYLEESAALDATLSQGGFRKVPRDWSYWNAPKFVFWLDLLRAENEVFKGMATNSQKEVRAGYRKGVEYSIGGKEDLPEFYRLMQEMSTTKGIAVHDAAYYARLYEVMNRSCRLELFLAKFEGRIISVGMSINYGTRAWLLYAASDRQYFKLRINRNVQWEMMKWAHGIGCVRYDFRGTATGDPPSPADPGYGVYEFKKSFGPRFVRLAGYYDLVTRPTWYSLFRLGEERVLPRAYQAKVWFDERKVQRASASAASAG